MTSNPQYGERTSGLEVAERLARHIQGKKILITGVSPKGIGGSTALAFASQKPSLLILASRTRSKLDSVAEGIKTVYPDVGVKLVTLDLSSQKSIRNAAGEVAGLTDALDVLVNNAGIVVYTREKTAEGIEWQFGTNHIGPFLFTNLLLPLLLKAAEDAVPGATRIVNLTSAGHRLSPVRFSDYNLEGRSIPPEEDHFQPLSPAFARTTEDGYNGIVAYAQPKTANILFTLYLQQHLGGRGISAYSLHPGSIHTELGRNQDEEYDEAFKQVAAYWKMPDEGSSTTIVASADPSLNCIKGLYMKDCQFEDPAPFARSPESSERLWHLSEELVGERFKVAV